MATTSARETSGRASHGAIATAARTRASAGPSPEMRATSGPFASPPTWLPAIVGSLLAYAAFPPLDCWPLAWVAPALWLLVVRRRELAGRRRYLMLWVAGFTFWFPVLHWLRLPHPVTILGWLALSTYLACYLPTFVAICRVAVHRLHVPLILAAPIAWTGLELAQSHLLTGFNMASLAHSQWRWLPVIQIADVGGGYAVTFLIMFVAACLATMLPWEGRRGVLWPVLPALAALGAVLAYGCWRLDHPAGKAGPTIALIQGSIDTELKFDPDKQREIHPHYFGLSQHARHTAAALDLIVWPETMFRDPLLSCTDDAVLPPTWPVSRDQLREDVMYRRREIAQQALDLETPVLLGVDYWQVTSRGLERFNSALFVDRQGRIGPRYDKMHPVLFGEYVPFAKQFEWLASVSPIGAGIDWGTEVPAFEVAGARLAANICYESAMSHVIRQQVTRLREEGKEPDVLVNLTNDGWFRGSSELDLHLTCGIFRAIECRKPFLIAANTGFSAWIDSDGRIVERGPRRAAAVIIARPVLDARRSPYLACGDWPAGICLLGACVVGLIGLWDQRKRFWVLGLRS
ncbi:MAG TPA: apolipoprotein N-acyltransferase [Pirellulales bacterium]|jgi:apolipoprotein N-acyltransferase|nr:apolipoprotein N-acyltransferase [Pirellulales bacterium]